MYIIRSRVKIFKIIENHLLELQIKIEINMFCLCIFILKNDKCDYIEKWVKKKKN